MSYVRLTAADVTSLGCMMTGLQDALQSPGPQVIGDVIVRLPVSGRRVPVFFDPACGDGGVYLVFAAAEEPPPGEILDP